MRRIVTDRIGEAVVSDERLVLVPIPALVAILLHVERTKGTALTEPEVLALRDGCVCVTMRYDMAEKMEQERGYRDIRPENAWEDWVAVRPSLGLDNT